METRKAQITQRIITLAAEQVGADPTSIVPASHFVNDLSFDSLDRVEFMMTVEDEFPLSVPDEEADRLDTIEKVVDYIVAHTADSQPQPS